MPVSVNSWFLGERESWFIVLLMSVVEIFSPWLILSCQHVTYSKFEKKCTQISLPSWWEMVSSQPFWLSFSLPSFWWIGWCYSRSRGKERQEIGIHMGFCSPVCPLGLCFGNSRSPASYIVQPANPHIHLETKWKHIVIFWVHDENVWNTCNIINGTFCLHDASLVSLNLAENLKLLSCVT